MQSTSHLSTDLVLFLILISTALANAQLLSYDTPTIEALTFPSLLSSGPGFGAGEPSSTLFNVQVPRLIRREDDNTETTDLVTLAVGELVDGIVGKSPLTRLDDTKNIPSISSTQDEDRQLNIVETFQAALLRFLPLYLWENLFGEMAVLWFVIGVTLASLVALGLSLQKWQWRREQLREREERWAEVERRREQVDLRRRIHDSLARDWERDMVNGSRWEDGLKDVELNTDRGRDWGETAIESDDEEYDYDDGDMGVALPEMQMQTQLPMRTMDDHAVC